MNHIGPCTIQPYKEDYPLSTRDGYRQDNILDEIRSQVDSSRNGCITPRFEDSVLIDMIVLSCAIGLDLVLGEFAGFLADVESC